MFDSVPDMAAKRAELSGDALAFRDSRTGRDWTFPEVDAAANGAVAALRARGSRGARRAWPFFLRGRGTRSTRTPCAPGAAGVSRPKRFRRPCRCWRTSRAQRRARSATPISGRGASDDRVAGDLAPDAGGIRRFARVSGDDNPIHVNPHLSARTAFGRTVAHGMLIYTKLWGMVCAARPGACATRQSMMFPIPAFAGEDVRLVVVGDLPGTVTMQARRVSDDAELFRGEAEVT